jgi:hypothetical protein
MIRSYAVEGFGEAKPPQDFYFHHQKEMILGGLAALQTSPL